jgi:ribose transport system substrate-binding protein
VHSRNITRRAACGGDDSGDDNATAAGSTTSAGLQAAKKTVAEATTRPTKINVTEKIDKPIPRGKLIEYVHCGVPACSYHERGLKAAAEPLGWKVRTLATNGTPESLKAAFEQAARDKPDAVVGAGTPKAVYAAPLKKLAAEHVPVFMLSVTDPVGDGLTFVAYKPSELPRLGDIMAAYATVITDGKANALYTNVPDFPVLAGLAGAFKQGLEKYCAGCSVAQLDTSITSIGKDSIDKIVSYLRAHPDVNVLVNGFGGLTIGVPAALKAAGLADKVKIIDEAPTTDNYQYIATGQQEATVAYPYLEINAQVVDAIARELTGQSLEPSNADPLRWLLTKDNLPETNDIFPLVPDYLDQFTQLWGVG